MAETSRLKGADGALWAGAAILAVPLAIRIYAGTLARYAGGDYCWPAQVSQRSFLSLQVYTYQHSFGRWASTALASAVAETGPLSARILPGVAIALWLAAMTWCLHELTHRLALAAVISETVIVATLTAAPQHGMEAVYWQTGMITYLPPFIIAPLGVAGALRFRSPVIAGVAAFVAAGFNEAFMALEVAALVLALVACRREHRSIVIAALAGAILSSVIVVASPGNALRHESVGSPPISQVPLSTLADTVSLLIRIVVSPIGITFLLMGAGLAANGAHIRWPRPIYIAGAAFVLALAAISPAMYGIHALQARTAIVPTFILVLGLLALTMAAGRWLPEARQPLALLVVSATFSAWATAGALSLVPKLHDYSNAWNAQDVRLTQAAMLDPRGDWTVDPIVGPFPQVWTIERDPQWPINRCVADYYGIASVRIP
jgi:Family of unknown function (DUF6056)